MGTQLTVIEPIPLPSRARPGMMPSLPEWAALRVATLKQNSQPDPTTGRHSNSWTLPQSLIPTDKQRAVMINHIASLRPRLDETPEKSDDCAKATIVLVTKMLMALPSAQSNDEAQEARGDAFMMALEDVPSWAVEAAIRGWHRKEYGPGYNYRWAPVPSELRTVAFLEAWKFKERIRDLQRVLDAKPFFEPRQDLAEKIAPLLTMQRAE